jgi:hypothetical protein
MKTIELKLFDFNELSDKAKENAINQVREFRWEYVWADEAFESLRAFVKVLGARIIDYSIDWESPNSSYVKVDSSNANFDFEFESSDYSLTGYYMDYPLVKTWKETKDIDDSIYAWLIECSTDYEYQISDEGIAEFIGCNEYEFTEQGNIY